MYEYTTKPRTKFDIRECYNQIAGAAFRFEDTGHLDIWIYLKAGVLSFHYCELKPLTKFFVAHYLCSKIIRGFSNSEWQLLGRKLARVYFSNK